jgi:acetylornithine deacetylase
MIDRDFAIDILQKLVRINSVNPSLEEGGPGEFEVGSFISEVLNSLGVEVIVDELEPARINVTGIIKGAAGGRSLMLYAHMDTVGIAGMQDPFSGKVEDGKLFGRGAFDMKASIAAIISVAKALKDNNVQLKGDLILAFVADEEFQSIGAEDWVKKYRPEAAIVTEPTNLHICLAHRGLGVFKISTKGKTAHGGNHEAGVDANMKMGLVLAELHKLSEKFKTHSPHPLCGRPSLHVPLISGGRSLFIYSNECHIWVERRTLPGETAKTVNLEFQEILDRLRESEPDFEASIQTDLWRSPYEVDPSKSIVKELLLAGSNVSSFQEEFIGHTWWEDSAIFGEAGIETVIIGPKGGGIHEEVEWVELDSAIDLAEILYRTSINYCGQ